MNQSTVILLATLVLTICFYAYFKVTNPYMKYSTVAYWEDATAFDVATIPDDALLPKAKNGPILMWAAAYSDDPAVISALINRGANVNEIEVDFGSTPLTAAAYKNPNTAVIDVLIQHGAKINEPVGLFRKTALLIAAEVNSAEITKRLIEHGADMSFRDSNGDTAQDIATKHENSEVISFYENFEE